MSIFVASIFGTMLKGLIRRVGKGLFDGSLKPVLNTAKGAITNFTIDNRKSKDGGEGKIDWIRLITSLATIGFSAWLIYQWMSGEKTTEEVNDGFELIDNMNELAQ